MIPTTWAPTITFIVYAIQATIRNTESLGIAQAFTSLALLILIAAPASKLLTVLPQFAAAMGCFERLQAFLLLPVVIDLSASEDDEFDNKNPSTISSRQPPEFEMQTFRPMTDVEPAVITVTDATIRPTATAPAVLSDASFRVMKASITALLGPTGSGKTTLLRTILGELGPDSGDVSTLSGPIAYCAQTPWMVNRSIRSNVCGPFARDTYVVESWYNRVLHACCLDTDISTFPHGDSTQVGSKGFSLSGGQKQRIVSSL